MIIARILGTVVSTQKDARLQGKKLLIVKPINLDGTDQSGYLVAVDTVGASSAVRARAWPKATKIVRSIPPSSASSIRSILFLKLTES
jgi:hypothetical protein